MTKTSAAKKSRTASPSARAPRRRTSRKAQPALRIVPHVPESLEQVELVQRAMASLGRREVELNDAVERLQAAYKDLGNRLESKRGDTERRLLELFARVRESRAGEAFEDLPERALEEVDELLERVGLVRKARHLEALEQAKKQGRAAGKRAARRELKKHGDESAAEG
jgi:hypothetical protein